MKEDKTVAKKGSAGKENEHVLENGKKKGKEDKPPTKVVVRRLPPTMTEEQFLNQISPLPETDYFYYVAADMSLTPHAFCRAYINFVDQSDLFIFTQKFDGYVFVDNKGGEFPAVVEFAPFQLIPKNRPNRKKDPKMGTVESDPMYIAFKERLEAQSLENRATVNASKQHFFETSLIPEKKEANNTPLLDYIKHRRAERQRIRDEKREEKRKKDLERRRAKEEQRKTKKEDETLVVKVLNNQSTSKERIKEKDVKQNFIKKKSDDLKSAAKEKSTSDSRPKETKVRTGKSYLEERQRQAERREEQRKKQSRSSSSVVDPASLSNPDDKTAINDEKLPGTEEKPSSDNKAKETDHKKSERVFKREEVKKNSYKYEKYETKRDRESDETRRARRASNDKSHQSSRRDDERSEDGGRKRYSESRKNHDSTRDRYKDKEKNKTYSQKKTVGSATELDRSKNVSGNSSRHAGSSDVIDENPEKDGSIVKAESSLKEGSDLGYKISVNSDSKDDPEEADCTSGKGVQQKLSESKDKAKPTRRNSLEYDKSRSSSVYSSSKLYNREKYSEKKRRNSVGSSKQNQERVEFSRSGDEVLAKSEELSTTKSASKVPLHKGKKSLTEIESELPTNEKDLQKPETEIVRDLPKRRNSTGERQGLEKSSPRRNSLGSEDKNQIFTFKEHKFDGGVTSEEDKQKSDKPRQRSSRDPRTERRIRNKDRPTMELYRPGMGKFSKQRLEREKGGLGSSTEVDSPSSSPSPTPVLKHKTASTPLH